MALEITELMAAQGVVAVGDQAVIMVAQQLLEQQTVAVVVVALAVVMLVMVVLAVVLHQPLLALVAEVVAVFGAAAAVGRLCTAKVATALQAPPALLINITGPTVVSLTGL